MTSEAIRLIGYRKFDDDGVTLSALSEPAYVDGLGLVVRVSLYDQRTYSGPTATVVLGARREAVELLAGAYRALGRDALAGIAEVHAANRDLPSVDVLRPR
ncbi:hypothetical protein [Dactylosporangium sp. NPDC050588]|uniref:hypothetical protein n=1 Tax=Dactylosporangium sp. NPDC050588 TaxID=3157211 RepID=UPI0033E4BB86